MAEMKTYNDFMYTKFPFGKHKGSYLKDISDKYLEWIVMNIEDRGICEMCSVELQRRNIAWRKNK